MEIHWESSAQESVNKSGGARAVRAQRQDETNIDDVKSSFALRPRGSQVVVEEHQNGQPNPWFSGRWGPKRRADVSDGSPQQNVTTYNAKQNITKAIVQNIAKNIGKVYLAAKCSSRVRNVILEIIRQGSRENGPFSGERPKSNAVWYGQQVDCCATLAENCTKDRGSGRRSRSCETLGCVGQQEEGCRKISSAAGSLDMRARRAGDPCAPSSTRTHVVTELIRSHSDEQGRLH